MIVVDFQLWSALTGHKSSRGLILIDNIRTYRSPRGARTVNADYRVRAYPKGVTVEQALAGTKPHREARVLCHPRDSKPVWNLMLKALKELGYEN